MESVILEGEEDVKGPRTVHPATPGGGSLSSSDTDKSDSLPSPTFSSPASEGGRGINASDFRSPVGVLTENGFNVTSSGSFMSARDSISSNLTKGAGSPEMSENETNGLSSGDENEDNPSLEDNAPATPVQGNDSYPSSSNGNSSTGQSSSFLMSLGENQIVQTNVQHARKEERDRAKRFEYLLERTEIWGHFMKDAYEEALTFADGETPGTSQSQGSSQNDTESSPSTSAAALAKGKARGRGRGKKKLTVPDMSHPSDGQVSKDYVTHFSSTPSFISWGTMRDYQVNGLNWLISLYERGISGILADEMGLGKTLETISLLGYLKHCRDIDGPHLVIAPKSTLPNWMNEISRWCPTLKAICLIGSKEERPALIKKSFLPKRWNVCVTSYEIAKIEKSTLKKVNYHYIVIDEAQKIKNENSLLANVVRGFHSSNRLLLTGTPLQNNLHELWALLNFLLPDVFSSSEDFDSWFNESSCMGNQSLVDRLHAILRPFLLRRIKSDVEKTLPPKVEMRLYVQLTPMQREWYRKVLLNDINVINDQTGKITKKTLSNIIMHLRKVCNHPYLFEGAEPKPFTTDSHLITNCGKMIVLDKLLLKVKSQDSRVLLFTQMTRVLDIIEDYCIWRGFQYCRLDGSTDYDIRQEDIDAFNAPNSDKFIYLLSTRAGGLGINLASANIVILYDSDWNPQMDLQAMDRAHRIGQTKEVKVFRFVVQDTLEEKIVERAAAKLHLDRMVIQQGRLAGAGVKAPTAGEMLNIVRFGADKILKSGEKSEISDADIETILAQSKLRSEEFDRRLNGMSEDNLKDLTIEQVELEWKTPSTDNDNSFFNFEGQNYRELRKRNVAIINDPIMEGKRRKDQDILKHGHGAMKRSLYSDDSDAESSISSGDPPVVMKPNIPWDFQFGSPFVWELYWKELDYFHRKLTSYQPCLPEDLSPDQAQFLNSAEIMRLGKCEPLTGAESREKEMLVYDQGFHDWKKKHFRQFVQAMLDHGPDNLQAIADAVKNQTIETVVCYSQRFWLKCHELQNADEILGKLNRTDLLQNRRKALQESLGKKINAGGMGEESWIKFEPERWKGQRFSSEDDNQLLRQVFEIGLETPDLFAILQSKLISDGFSPFLRTRTKEELHSRFNLLMHMIEAETNQSGTSSSPVIPKQEANELVLNGDHRSVWVPKNEMDSPRLVVKGIKKERPSSSQSSSSSRTSVAKSSTNSPGIGMGVTPKSKKRKWVNEGNNDEDTTPTKSSRHSQERFYE